MRRLCAIAEVSRCGYYKYLRQGSEKQAEDKRIGEMILKIQEQYHYSIGSRKMVPLLEKEAGKKYGIKRTRRIMKENNLQSTVRAKKYSDEVYIRRRKRTDPYKSCFHVIPHLRYGTCCPCKGSIVSLPSLLRHYPLSSLLCNDPTSSTLF